MSVDRSEVAMSLLPSMAGVVKMFVVSIRQHLRAERVVKGRAETRVAYSLRNSFGTLEAWKLSFERWRTKAD